MARAKRRVWTDIRDGTEWQVLYNPGVEEDPPAVRFAREGLLFRSGAMQHHAPAVYGDDLQSLTDADLQGLLDQARTPLPEAGGERASAEGVPTPVSEPPTPDRA